MIFGSFVADRALDIFYELYTVNYEPVFSFYMPNVKFFTSTKYMELIIREFFFVERRDHLTLFVLI